MFQAALGTESEERPLGFDPLGSDPMGSDLIDSDLVDSAASVPAASEPDSWILYMVAIAMIYISLVALRKLASHFFAKSAPQTNVPLFKIEDLLIIFGLWIFSTTAVVSLILTLFDDRFLAIPSSAIISILMMVMTITVHRKRCVEQNRPTDFFIVDGTSAGKLVGVALLALLCYLPAHLGVSWFWDSLLHVLDFDNDVQQGVVVIRDAIQQQNWGLLLSMALMAVVIAPCIEEVLFRGLLFRFLRDQNGFFPAALISSMLFGLMHDASWGPLVVLGFLLAWLYQRSGNLLVSIIFHATFNSVTIGLLFLVEYMGWGA